MDMNTSTNEVSFFYCYNPEVARFLIHYKKIKYNCTGRHIVSGDQFWQFSISNELSESLKEYKGRIAIRN